MFSITVTGCATGGKKSDLFTGQTVIGEFQVKWDYLPILKDKVAEKLTPLIFTYSSDAPKYNNGISNQDWINEAERLGTDVSTAKVIYGNDAYIGENGKFAICTIGAIQNGLCGKKLGLSIEQRADMAMQMLDESAVCDWIGFDNDHHTLHAYKFGASEFTLHVIANCTSP